MAEARQGATCGATSSSIERTSTACPASARSSRRSVAASSAGSPSARTWSTPPPMAMGGSWESGW
jgi:hypothetical protein